MASLILRTCGAFVAVAALSTVGCAGDTTALDPTTPEGLDAAADSTMREDALLDDTTDGGAESAMPLDTEPAESGLDSALDAAVLDATPDAPVDAPVETPVDSATDALVDSLVETSVFDSATDSLAIVDLGSDSKACVAPLTTSSKGVCDTTTQSWVIEGAGHHEPGTPLSYCTKPPSSGDHYSQWAAYRVYDKPVPYGYLVHDLEHGAVVILYKCASGSCPTVQAEVVAVVNARPVDPSCADPVKRRVIVAPDPTLDVAIGAASWGFTYRASCVHAPSLGKFIDDRYGKGPEDTCADGVVPP